MTDWPTTLLALNLLALFAFLFWLAARPARPADTRQLAKLVADLTELDGRLRGVTQQLRQMGDDADRRVTDTAKKAEIGRVKP